MIPSMTIRTVVVAGLLATLVDASATGRDAVAGNDARVCLGTDDVLRLTRGERCLDGQRMYRLVDAETDFAIATGDEPASAVVAELERKIDVLARRVANLEKNSADVAGHSDGEAGARTINQVTAPFEVVDRSGKPIFVVADVPHATVAKRGRVQVARAQGGNTYSLVVRSAGDVPVAGIGDLSQGGGLYIGDARGTPRISATGEAGLELLNTQSKPTVHLTTGPGGAGQLWLYDEGGRPMVKAGTISDFGGVGIIQVGPGIKCVPMGTFRVPDCVRGRPEQ